MASGCRPTAARRSTSTIRPPASRSAPCRSRARSRRAAPSKLPTPRSRHGARPPRSSARSCCASCMTPSWTTSSALAELLTIEQGKSLFESKGEIGSRPRPTYLWFAEEGRRTYGDVVPSPWADRRILVTKEPVGVIAAITPWNFPSSMLAAQARPGTCRRLHRGRQAGVADALFRPCLGRALPRRSASPRASSTS